MSSMNKDQNDELVIVIPIFNRFDEIKNLLNQLENQSYKNFKVLIVDHGTQDFILSSPPDQFPIEIIKASSQLWFTGAVNRGLEYVINYAGTYIKYVLIMNDDIIIEDLTLIEKLLDEADDEKIVSCMAITEQNKIIYAGIKLEKFKFRYRRIGQGKNVEELSDDKIICDVLPTRCLLVSIKIIQEIGLLNENRLPHYGSDYEWTSRAKKSGFKLVMISSIYLKTKINNKEVSAKKKYEKPIVTTFFKEFFNKYRRSNIYQIINYSWLVFGFPYNLLFASFSIFRKITGFFINIFLINPYRAATLKKEI